MPDINAILRKKQHRATSKYGAQMGRSRILNAKQPCRLYLQRIVFQDGDYDSGGAYWGGPPSDPLYCAFAGNDDDEIVVMLFVRAKSREEAKQLVLDDLPEEGYSFWQ